MTTAIEGYLRTHTHLSEEHIKRVSALAIPRKLKRNEHLLTAGEVCRCKTFIVSGMLRIYSVSADGSEPIVQFSPELSWALDAESYDQQLPARYNIAAVEPSEILLWHKPDFDLLLKELPELKAFSQQLISRNSYNVRNRLLAALSASPEEKYEDFARSSPNLLARLPLRMIAAYLGMSLKTLTRIRHAQLTR